MGKMHQYHGQIVGENTGSHDSFWCRTVFCEKKTFLDISESHSGSRWIAQSKDWKKNIKVLRTGADRDLCPGGKVPQYFCILLHVPRNNIIQPVQSAVDPNPENYPQ